MKKIYNNDNVIVVLRYNSGLSTLAKSSLTIAAAIGVYALKEVAEIYKVKTAMEIWAGSNGVNSNIPCLINIIIVKTTTSNDSIADVVGTLIEKSKR